ncbi:hypothetical protein [Flavobacterium sp. GT3R68]|uniref:hypothetical protein n=1 Tax=Flavobacterium sp. GT3R68 TaxID=2594437 RepID=UPI000F87072C|nr:hypothetical protein [Flavobacterium sp. GT3R68]RTY85986.1 hypothetical protein EKL32_28185 [Flavobacterium sp. GSN2]TRW90116.1 hypothetical protein FNW07_11705 [Flavobacterium sp. GT3R68]
MSNSIIKYKSKYFNPNDCILIMSLCQIKEFIKGIDLPVWVSQYFVDVIDVIIDVQPIGWCDLELDEYFDSQHKNIFFINLLKECISNLNKRADDWIRYEEVNNLFKLEGIEKWGEKNYILIQDVTDCLGDLVLLLDEEIETDFRE